MKREEAIKILKTIKVYECYPKSASEETKEAIDMAIEALQTDAIPLEHHRKVLYKTVDQDIEIARLKNRIKEMENG